MWRIEPCSSSSSSSSSSLFKTLHLHSFLQRQPARNLCHGKAEKFQEIQYEWVGHVEIYRKLNQNICEALWVTASETRLPQPFRLVPSFAFFHNSIIKVVVTNICNWKVCIALTKGLTALMLSQEHKCVAAESKRRSLFSTLLQFVNTVFEEIHSTRIKYFKGFLLLYSGASNTTTLLVCVWCKIDFFLYICTSLCVNNQLSQ